MLLVTFVLTLQIYIFFAICSYLFFLHKKKEAARPLFLTIENAKKLTIALFIDYQALGKNPI